MPIALGVAARLATALLAAVPVDTPPSSPRPRVKAVMQVVNR